MSGPPTSNTRLEHAVAFQRDLYLCWRTARLERGLALTRRHALTRAHVRTLRAALGQTDVGETEPESARMLFLRRFAQRLGLLQLRETPPTLLASAPDQMSAYLARSFAERLRLATRLWVTGAWWPDQPGTPGEAPRLMAPAAPRVALARRRLLDALVALPPGSSVRIPPLPLSRRGVRRDEEPDDGYEVASAEDAMTVRAALLGPLCWLGLVTVKEWSGEAADEPRLCHTSGALAALRGDATLPEAHGRIVIQADMTVTAFPPLTAPALHVLDSSAERQSTQTTVRFAITRRSLGNALASGAELDDLLARLRALTDAELPDVVRTRLSDWARQASRVRLIRSVDVLMVEHPTTLDALLADRAAAGWVLRRLSPTTALLAEGRASQAHAWLLRRGEAPAWEHAGTAER
ncbi:MAG TPA: helicase-associated domain-containing protein [Ktedonobacterales bacterium]